MQQDKDLQAETPLDELARQIEEQSRKADKHVLKAAELVKEARRRVEADEGRGLTWMAWARTHIKLSPSRLYELNAIAEAADPAKELERIRKSTETRVRKHREKEAAKKAAAKEAAAQKNCLEPERKQLIDWAKKAPLEEVRRVLEQVASNDNKAPKNDQPEAAASQNAA